METATPIPVDEPDFEQLVSAYYESLFRFALSLTQREAEASDLTQQTFYLWATKGHQLRDKSKVKSWLFTTLHREFLGSRRRETRFPHYEVEQVSAELPVIQPVMVQQMDSTMVLEALAEVDELYRAPLVLFYLEESSYQEIADVLKLPAGTVMSRLSRGKEQLRKVLAAKVTRKERKIVPLEQSVKERKSHE